MGGGLMQLVAYGAQDIYLTGNPQITFFKVVYRRHTNFSMEAIEQTWNGGNGSGATAGADGRCTATISRNGDLVHRMYLELTGITLATFNNVGSSVIKTVELEIGGQKIDKHTGLWMETWAELTQENPTGGAATHSTVGDGTKFQNMSGMGGVDGATDPYHITVPLQFWFCRNPGLALPLIALQYHEVKVVLEHAMSVFSTGSPTNKLWCDYIYLDTDERRRFAQVSHEYLIEQVQDQGFTSSTQELNFNHPVKELIWTCADVAAGLAAARNIPPCVIGTVYQLKLNGHDRFAGRDSRYFSRTQVWEHHSGAGGLDSAGGVAVSCQNDSINVYSFALKPEEHQPSGTCNFSRIDNAQLTTGGATPDPLSVIFAVNYNVLRIMSGMGGLAYSN